jgi:hypothetical protein
MRGAIPTLLYVFTVWYLNTGTTLPLLFFCSISAEIYYIENCIYHVIEEAVQVYEKKNPFGGEGAFTL